MVVQHVQELQLQDKVSREGRAVRQVTRVTAESKLI